ncbi:uncharacterized protein [Diabrotica undecimpunctata]|uniref:uncharacterized protein n=1 Tax=Diabrotica undecimpunctata TaxID=50387 RepID=UPI003B638510
MTINGYVINYFTIAVCIIGITNIPNTESAVRCFKCLSALPQYYTNETIRLCKDFDYSDKFIVECPFSTYCMKKFTSAKIPTTINGTERNCANQKHVIQNYHHGQWHQEVSVEEPYTPGCHKINDKGARTSSMEYCYCNTDLCNCANSYSEVGIGFVMALIVFILS